ncbi:hypothetical protein DAVIS_04864 [Mycobacterium marinum]|uniref:Uncharacterized protein n=1 Tax=Mycobacterium marinum TaxID=1781 RepID=A0A3E2MPU0_MYCMR|nr:hypothetical protein DAVIS_04864 [Mycobacterium marinum]
MRDHSPIESATGAYTLDVTFELTVVGAVDILSWCRGPAVARN